MYYLNAEFSKIAWWALNNTTDVLTEGLKKTISKSRRAKLKAVRRGDKPNYIAARPFTKMSGMSGKYRVTDSGRNTVFPIKTQKDVDAEIAGIRKADELHSARMRKKAEAEIKGQKVPTSERAGRQKTKSSNKVNTNVKIEWDRKPNNGKNYSSGEPLGLGSVAAIGAGVAGAGILGASLLGNKKQRD